MHAGTAAAAAAATSGAGGLWLFSYNKENFGYDAGMRFGRFTMSRTFANAQVAQYREDIHGICETTISKMDTWQTVTTLFLAVAAALSCAGRIGMHGAAPPGWLCALFSGCIFMSVMFNGLSLWLSMHASLRAQAAAVSLLTRKVRLPIPSLAQLDQARVFGSAYEKQEFRDIFRVPFMRHPQEAPDMPSAEKEEDKGKKPKKNKNKPAQEEVHDPQKEFASTARDTVPSWIHDEAIVDKGGGFSKPGEAPVHEAQEQPEHFRLLMQAQEEWRDYDVYARVSMLYGVVSFLYAVTYYCIGTAIAELRGFWVMWTLPMVFMCAQCLILRLDILKSGSHVLPNAEFIGHLAPFAACAANTLEYRYYYSEANTGVTWCLVCLAFFCHLVMALRMFDLARPASCPAGEMPEEPGKQWWPASWQVPLAFTKHLWFITPPKKLEDKQHCLLHEMEDMAAHGGGVGTCRRRKPRKAAPPPERGAGGSVERSYSGSLRVQAELKRRNDLPWRLLRIAVFTAAGQWSFMLIATGVEVVLGPESLLKPPGEPPWIRDTKYRSYTPENVHLSSSGGLPGDYRLFAASTAHYPGEEHEPSSGEHGEHGEHEEHGHDAHGAHRRLGGHLGGRSGGHLSGRAAALQRLLELAPLLGELADEVGGNEEPAAVNAMNVVSEPVAPAGGFLGAGPDVRRVEWPQLFEPQHLACGPAGGEAAGQVLALTGRGFGALVPARGPGAEGATDAEPFALEGASHHGKIAGAAWTREGLELVTALGGLLRCPGHAPAAGAWTCGPSPHPPLVLPAGAQLLTAAIRAAEAEGAEPLLALVFKHLPGAAQLFGATGGSWIPRGEVHLPPAAGGLPSLSFDREALLVSTGAGEVHRRALSAAAASARHPAPAGVHGGYRFRAACATPGMGLLRLALRRADGSQEAPWRPELVMSP